MMLIFYKFTQYILTQLSILKISKNIIYLFNFNESCLIYFNIFLIKKEKLNNYIVRFQPFNKEYEYLNMINEGNTKNIIYKI